ncbi:hypothetical protein FQR65_LT16426 [Abscondita terminalis]|nr:hypothetical protein FQR65_LT16426 [Abscondita terminalis]
MRYGLWFYPYCQNDYIARRREAVKMWLLNHAERGCSKLCRTFVLICEGDVGEVKEIDEGVTVGENSEQDGLNSLINKLPITNDETIEEFENFLQNEKNFTIMMKELARLGEDSEKEIAKRILYYFTNEIGQLYSWEGATKTQDETITLTTESISSPQPQFDFEVVAGPNQEQKHSDLLDRPTPNVRNRRGLRTQFSKECNKIRGSQTSGVGTDGVYKPTWWCFDLLLFLNDADPVRPSTTNLEVTQGSTNEDDGNVIFEGTMDQLQHQLQSPSSSSRATPEPPTKKRKTSIQRIFLKTGCSVQLKPLIGHYLKIILLRSQKLPLMTLLQAAQSSSVLQVSVEELSPLPKNSEVKAKSRKPRKKGKTGVINSTPDIETEKLIHLEKQQKERQKLARAAKRKLKIIVEESEEEREQNLENSDEEVDDPACLYCNELYSWSRL